MLHLLARAISATSEVFNSTPIAVASSPVNDANGESIAVTQVAVQTIPAAGHRGRRTERVASGRGYSRGTWAVTMPGLREGCGCGAAGIPAPVVDAVPSSAVWRTPEP